MTECEIRYSIDQADYYRNQGLCIPDECVDGALQIGTAADARSVVTNGPYDPFQTRNFDKSTGIYTVFYALRNFTNIATELEENVHKAMRMIEKDVCVKFQRVSDKDLDSHDLHIYG